MEHVLGMLAAGDTPETILEGYPWLEPEDIRACLTYAHRLVAHERVEPAVVGAEAWTFSRGTGPRFKAERSLPPR